MSEPAVKTGQPVSGQSAALSLLISFIRGGNQVAVKTALTAFSPLWTAFGRMAISCLTVWLWSRARGYDLRPQKGEIRPLALLAALFTVQISLLHTGADYTSPAYAVILVNVNPIVANLLAHFYVPEDSLSPRRALGLVLAFAGVVWVFLGKPDPGLAPNPTLGNALIVLSASLVAARTVYIQRLVQNMRPEKAVFWQMLASLPFFLAGGTFFKGAVERIEISWEPLTAMVYQGVFVGGFSLVLWIYLLRKHTPGTITVFSFATPISGLLLSAWLFGERLTPNLLIGVAVILAGIFLVSRSRSPMRPVESPL